MDNYFECCHQCVQPKRHPGCHDTCEEYLEQKAKWLDDKNKRKKEHVLDNYVREKNAKIKDGIARYTRRRANKDYF